MGQPRAGEREEPVALRLDESPCVPPIESAVTRGRFTPGEARQARRLTLVIAIVGSFFVVELGGALLADSVVLQADAVHLLTDVLALSVSLIAMRLAVRAPTGQFTYGLRRAEPVAAILSASLVLVTTGAIVAEGVKAFEQRTAPKAGLMLLVAIAALAVNGLSAWLLHDAIGHGAGPVEHDPEPTRRSHGHALNLRGAWLHLAGDTLGAVGALAAAVFIRLGGDVRADPIASFVVAGILLVGSARLVRDAALVLLEAAPRHLPVHVVRRLVAEFPGVREIRELHVWALGAGHDAITVRVGAEGSDFTLAERLSHQLRRALGAEYVTVQVEPRGGKAGGPGGSSTEAT